MAHLLIRKKNQKRQRHIEVGHLPLTIGRAPTNGLILPGADVSRSHCVIEPTGAGVKILDVGSRHGLRVNHELQTETYLRHGDRIQVGTYELVYPILEH